MAVPAVVGFDCDIISITPKGTTTNELELHTRAANIANSYLIEMLLGQLVNQQPDQLAAIEHLRFLLSAQMYDDFDRGLHTGIQDNADALRASVAQVLTEAFDRAASQYEKPAQPLGSA